MYISFTRARISLAAWYSAILCIILLVFSIALYSAQNDNLTRVVLQRDFGNHPPRTLTKLERKEIIEQIYVLRHDLVVTLLAIDAVVLVLGTGLSFFLAGKTLAPIEASHEQQKEFLANASHELRTPLAALQTTTEVALRKDKSKEVYKSVIEQTLEESVRLGKIVNDLLTLSRADSSSSSVILKKTDIVPVIEDVLVELQPVMKAKGIQLKKELQSMVVMGDIDKLKQLVVILIDNAIKYSSKGGVITVKTKGNIPPTLEVTDTGMGMTNETQAHIFERFYRADTSRSTVGAGLGLSIAKWIADMHNAEIEAKSKLGKGTTFQVVFN